MSSLSLRFLDRRTATKLARPKRCRSIAVSSPARRAQPRKLAEFPHTNARGAPPEIGVLGWSQRASGAFYSLLHMGSQSVQFKSLASSLGVCLVKNVSQKGDHQRGWN